MYKCLSTIWVLLLFASSSSLQAQVDNYALKFSSDGSVSFGRVPELDKRSEYTVQFWMCPAEWKSGAVVCQRGDSFSVRLGAKGELLFTVGKESVSVISPELAVGKWVHLSFIRDKQQLRVLVNNKSVVATQSPLFVIPASRDALVLGGAYTGRIDEFRIWGVPLSAEYNYMWQNTLNKFHPQWKQLIAYYKFDQNLCPNVVDYTFRHHGVFSRSGVSREQVSDNAAFTYFTVAAYTTFPRFGDRQIDRDKHLLANTLIILGIASDSDGNATMPYPFHHGTVSNGEYLAQYKGRSGVLSLGGKGAQMEVAADLFHLKSTYTLRTWIYLEEWTTGTFLLKKEASPTMGFSVRLGSAAGKQLIVRVNGKETTRNVQLPVGKWVYLDESFVVPEAIQAAAVIGENLHAKLDDTVIWSGARDAASVLAEKVRVPMLGFDKVIAPTLLASMEAYWSYDDPKDIGYDSYSCKHFTRLIRSAYDGYRGFKMMMSVSGHPDWQTTFADAAKREKLGKAIANILNTTDFDGVDLDFEWAFSEGVWLNYAKLVEVIRKNMLPGKLLTVTPHKVSYQFPLSYMKYVDYFLFQIYGPNDKNIFEQSGYEAAYDFFINWGYPKDKIVMSYATTTTGGTDADGNLIKVGTERKYPPVGVCNLFDDSYTPDKDRLYDKANNCYRYITGYNQVIWRSDFVRSHHLKGIFYWDMGNDVKTAHPYSLAKASSFSLNANVDSLVTTVRVIP